MILNTTMVVLAKINRIPEKLKQIYATAFEVDPNWLVDAGCSSPKMD